MSIALRLHELSDSEINLCEHDLVIEEIPRSQKKKKTLATTFFARPLTTIDAYRKEGDSIMVPFDWGATHFGNTRRTPRNRCDAIKATFLGRLRPEQLEYQREALAIMNKRGSCLLSIYPGGGKTITSLSIAYRVGLKTFILVNKLVLINQWVATIGQVFGATVRFQVLYPKTKPDPMCDFYIMNAINVCKKSFTEYEHLRIGFVIVDECHLMMTRTFSQALTYFCPRYLIGLSATPFRPDGYDIFLNLYFGREKVVRQLYRKHLVYLWETGIRIDHEKDKNGELVWNSVIEKQTGHAMRNTMICTLCRRFPDRNILILSKRVKQIETLATLLSDAHESVTMIREGESTFDLDARIVIATFQKVGTGFSHDKLDMLIIATDAEEYFIQYLGRVFRTPHVEPIVVDIVDNHPVLKKHFQSRKKIYEAAGGTIRKYDPRILNLTPEYETENVVRNRRLIDPH